MKQLLTLWMISFTLISYGQSKQTSSAKIYEDLQRFANTGTVMYVAAHPDDENTRLISWLTNAQHLNTVYLSLTRGDGGQNLIGTEKGPLLGLLRTQELLEARKVDGGNQFFTRANDFGYSKTATETLAIWDEEVLLGDVVWAIRKHQPDVMITRFDPDSNGETHGHHTTSAILAQKAFDLAGDPTAYPEQLKYVSTWQPKRLFFNTSWWFYGSQEAFDKVDKSTLLSFDVGDYFPTIGLSNNEIAALSRSKHACQGFGAELQRGSQKEWIKLLKGDMPSNDNLMQGIQSKWQDSTIEKELNKAIKNFDFKTPEKITEQLISVYKRIKALPESSFKEQKLQACKNLILSTTGIYIEATANKEYGVGNETISVNYEITNRSTTSIEAGVDILNNNSNYFIQEYEEISPNEKIEFSKDYTIPSGQLSSPYWLVEPQKTIGLYEVSKQTLIGLPETKPLLNTFFSIKIEGEYINFNLPVFHKHIDPAIGEIYEPFYVVEPVAINIKEPVYLFAANAAQQVEVEVTAFSDNVSGSVQLNAGMEWIISESQSFSINQKGGKQTLTFKVIPPKKQILSELKASALINGKSYFNRVDVVDYNHINKQMVFMPSTATIGKVEMEVPNVNVGYIQGSGDEVPQSLRQVGVQVTELQEDQWNLSTFKKYDVIILGIRAFNTLETLPYSTEDLWAFAKQGGTVIMQYNTNRGIPMDKIAPYKLQLGRDRISQEEAKISFLAKNHEVLTTPNKITQADFNDWVQERGLYFASEWATEFTPILEGHDSGESPKQGMLLVADVGEGHYVYTGISFFRELPAGVPGAYRLMMNLLSLGEKK